MKTASKKILVLGLGNDIMRDDGVGLRVVRQLRQHLPVDPCVEVRESTEMGLALLDHVAGFDELVIVDAVQTGKAQPGTVHIFDPTDLKPARLVSPHLIGVSEMLAFGLAVGLPMPRRVVICGIEVEDPFTVDTEISPSLQRALPEIIGRIATVVLELQSQNAAKVQPNAPELQTAPDPDQSGV